MTCWWGEFWSLKCRWNMKTTLYDLDIRQIAALRVLCKRYLHEAQNGGGNKEEVLTATVSEVLEVLVEPNSKST